VVADALAESTNVDFIEDRNTIRQEARKILEDLLNQEEEDRPAARQKIESQKRTILEGSQEWDILYRKYYNEEVKKLGLLASLRTGSRMAATGRCWFRSTSIARQRASS
jgi:hypothetical protein